MRALIFLLIILVDSSFGSDKELEDISQTRVSDLTLEQFYDLVKTITQTTLQDCVVEGQMQGKAKLNLDVEGEVVAKIVCQALEIDGSNRNSDF